MAGPAARLLMPATTSDRTTPSRRTPSDQTSSGMSSGRAGGLACFAATISPHARRCIILKANSHDPEGRFASSRRQSHEPRTFQLTDKTDIPVSRSRERDNVTGRPRGGRACRRAADVRHHARPGHRYVGQVCDRTPRSVRRNRCRRRGNAPLSAAAVRLGRARATQSATPAARGQPQCAATAFRTDAPA